MKVLIANTALPPVHLGGAEIYAMAVAKCLSRFGATVSAVAFEFAHGGNDGQISCLKEIYDGVKIYRLCRNEAHLPLSVIWTGSEESDPIFNEILDEEKPDILHVMSHSRLSRLIELAHSRGIPVVMTGMDFLPFCERGILLRGDNSLCDGEATIAECAKCTAFSRLGLAADWHGNAVWFWNLLQHLSENTRDTFYSIFEHLIPAKLGIVKCIDKDGYRVAKAIREFVPHLLGNLDCVFAPSPVMRQVYEKKGYPSDKIVDLVYGVDLNEQSQQPGFGYKTASKHFRFAFVGRLDWPKNILLLLEAFSLLKDISSAKLVLYGAASALCPDDNLMERVKESARKNSKVHLAGRINRTEVTEAYQDIDCLVVPSRWYENSPITILEAQYMRTPVICTDLPGMNCLVKHEENGLLFHNMSANSLASQMCRIVEDIALYDHLRANAMRVMPIEENVEIILGHYERLLTEKGKSWMPVQGRKKPEVKQEPILIERELGLEDELAFWERELSEERRYPHHVFRLQKKTRRKGGFPEFVLPLVREAQKSFGVSRLKAIEIGPGPISTLAYLVDEGLCEIMAIDPLAKEFCQLLEKYGIEYPIKPIQGTAETLFETVPEAEFHMGFAFNVIDHTISPMRSMENLCRAVKPGGFVCLSHFFKEGSREAWYQLHKWDLSLQDHRLVATNRIGHQWVLDRGLFIEMVYLNTTEHPDFSPQIQIAYRHRTDK